MPALTHHWRTAIMSRHSHIDELDDDNVGLCRTQEVPMPPIAPPAICDDTDTKISLDNSEYGDGEQDDVTEETEEEQCEQSTVKYSKNQLNGWKRRFRKTLMGLGLLGLMGTAAGGLVKHAYERGGDAQETAGTASISTPQKDSGVSSTDEPETNTSIQVEPAFNPLAAHTLYERIGLELGAHAQTDASTTLVMARLHAEVTNAITESLYTGTSWTDLNGNWLDTPAAKNNLVKKLQTWGGYEDELVVSAGAHNIDDMLEQITNSDLPNAELLAWKLATQIASIQDAEVVPNVEAVKERIAGIDTAKVRTEIQKRLPPSTETAQLDDVYDAPAPGNLQGMDAAEAENDVSAYLAQEVEVEEYDEPEIAAPAKPEPTSAPSFIERAKTAINSLASKFKSWWS